MNIFILDEDVKKCATYHCDKHVVKMILESAQLLSNVYWININEYDITNIPIKRFLKFYNINHPCSKWVRESLSNWSWLLNLFEELLKEYTYRYGKKHIYNSLPEWFRNNKPHIVDNGLTMFIKAMPDYIKEMYENPIDAYRAYYRLEKYRFCKWKNREVPFWF